MIPNRIGAQGARAREKTLPVQMALPSHLLMELIPGGPPGHRRGQSQLAVAGPVLCTPPPHPFRQEIRVSHPPRFTNMVMEIDEGLRFAKLQNTRSF